jgi:hypothetical protein
VIETLKSAYRLLLCSFPQGFRSAFADEMQQVFGEALADAARSGWRRTAYYFARELIGAMWLLLCEYWLMLTKEGMMSETLTVAPYKSKRAVEPSGWIEVLLAFVPIIFWVPLHGRYFLRLSALEYRFMLLAVIYLTGVILFVLGARRGYPAWWLPYATFVVMMLLGLPNLRIAPGQMMPIWVPLSILIVILALMWIFGALKNVPELVRRFGQDGTLVSFGIYNALPWLLLGWTELTDRGFMAPFVILAFGVLIAGSLAYLRATVLWQRFAALAIASPISMTIIGVSTEVYWSSVGKGNGFIGFIMSVIMILVMTLIVAVPGMWLWAVRETRSSS